ncbi:MAG: MFS transporter [SAR324 cluster bacterium]|nr:MFS transporter [SAR324 cluster bacterium]
MSLLDLMGEKKLRTQEIYIFLVILTVATAFGLQVWRTLYNNYAAEVVGLNGLQNGVVQSIREIPGFLALLVIYLLLIINEHRLAALSVLIMGLGICLTGLLPSFYGLIFTTLMMSFGFHYFETLNQSLTLQHFDTHTSPLVFGRLRSLGAASNILVGGLVFGLTAVLPFQSIYIIFGLLVVMFALYCFKMDPVDKTLPPQSKGIVVRKEYWLFYMLTCLAGARRQVFMAFAVFLLVKNFEYTVRIVTILFVINNVVNYFLSPIIGKAINRFGERKVLSLEYFSLIFIFLTYAFTSSALVAGIMYIMDHIFFNFGIAIRTYFQKISRKQDIAPSMAVGFTINHVAAVVIPTIGGWLWMVDHKIPFIAGAVLSLFSLVLTQFIKVKAAQS